jgi:hypothetical protein
LFIWGVELGENAAAQRDRKSNSPEEAGGPGGGGHGWDAERGATGFA